MKASRCKLGIMRPLVANAKQKQCENCEETFDNKSRLAKHKKYCTKLETMSVKEQKIRLKQSGETSNWKENMRKNRIC